MVSWGTIKKQKTMKKSSFFIVGVVIATLSFSSCCSINYPIISSAPDIGSKVGEASSYSIFGIGSGGPKATLKDAARNGGITKVNHVERTRKSIFMGSVIKYTTRVYGD
jgi:hypothetical protein